MKEGFLEQKQPNPKKKHYSDYEPSNAIYVNDCDYRRWCRVKEWFDQYSPDNEILQKDSFNQIKMDT